MSNAWDGTRRFHNAPEGGDHWPVGDVAFRTTSADLHKSAVALREECEYADEDQADTMVAIAEWYDDLALDLAAIHNLPEYTGSLFQAIGLIDVDPDEDIPF